MLKSPLQKRGVNPCPSVLRSVPERSGAGSASVPERSGAGSASVPERSGAGSASVPERSGADVRVPI
jgi:hypothetical protein